MIEDEISLAKQLFDLEDVRSFVPEKTLITAILERAVSDLFSKKQEERASAIRWFLDEGADYVFAFNSCLDHLDLLEYKKEFLSEVLKLDKFHLRSAVR